MVLKYTSFICCVLLLPRSLKLGGANFKMTNFINFNNAHEPTNHKLSGVGDDGGGLFSAGTRTPLSPLFYNQ
jgi:hypothetical protein